VSLEDEFADLESKLFEIPEAKFVQLVKFLEDRLEKSGESVPLRMLLEKMRPRMAQVRPHRRNTTQRQLCRPFEELLFNTRSQIQVEGRIPRAAVEPIYGLFEDDVDKAQIAAWNGELAELPIEDAKSDVIGSKVWAQGAFSLRSVLVTSQRDRTSRGELLQRLGGEHVFKALNDVVEILEIADIVQSMRRQLPARPIQTVSTAVTKVIGEHMDRATKFAPRKAEILLLVAPWAASSGPGRSWRRWRSWRPTRRRRSIRTSPISPCGRW
jgi:hypothetical protein